MDPLQHDPKTKKQIKDALDSFLYDTVRRQFKSRLDQLIVRNTLLTGNTHKSFMYKNTLYNCDIDPLPRKLNRLDLVLQPYMNSYLKDVKQLNEKEIPYVIGYVNQVLNSSNNFNDYLLLLPEAVHMPLIKLVITCPCRSKLLHPDEITLIQEKNQASISLMKQRMFTNLII